MTATISSATAGPSPRVAGGPGMVALLRLAATGGRSDRLRIALTSLGAAAATVILLAGAAVAFISDGDGPYELDVLDQPGLRPGVMISLLMLCVPVLVFVGLCTRVGAPARDRRLAMFRMAGATPGETTRIAAFETGLAAFVGSIVGTVVFFVGRIPLDSTSPGAFTVQMDDGSTREVDGLVRLLPTDVSIPIVAVLALIVTISLGSTVTSALALRKVRISPFGVTRTAPPKPPSAAAAMLFVVGTGGLVVLGVAARSAGEVVPAFALVAFVLFVVCVSGLLVGSAAISSGVGRFLAPRVGRPDLLIASRRMIAAPYTSSRATASVLLAVIIGAAIQGTRINFLTSQDPNDTFYTQTFRLLDGVLIVAIVLATANLLVTNAEAIVERRRTLAALTAAGTPKPVLARAVLMETLVPLVPSVLLAGSAGMLAARSFFGTRVETFVYDADLNSQQVTLDVPIPWDRLAVLCGGTIAISIAITALSLVLLGRSTRPSELRAAA